MAKNVGGCPRKEMLVDRLAKEINFCLCPMCKNFCTVHRATRREADAVPNRMYILESARKSFIDFNARAVDLMYQCTTCGLCKEWCVTRQDVSEIMETARADIVNLSKAPKCVLELDTNLKAVKNPDGEPYEKRFQSVDLARAQNSKPDIIWFVGCTTGHNQPHIVKATQKILDSANVSYTVLSGEEWCCGFPAYSLGLRETARQMAEHNAAAIKAAGAKTVVTSCPTCARALKLEYPKWGIPRDFDVLHSTEFIQKLMSNGKVKMSKAIGKTLTYHDSCDLGRFLGVYDAPREILKNLPESKIVEMRWNRNKSHCCGSGGGYRTTHPRVAAQISEDVVGEAVKAKAEVLVTSCPLCKLAFTRPARGKLEVKDITEIVAETL